MSYVGENACVYVVDSNHGRGAGFRSNISLWEDTLPPVLLLLVHYRGHSKNSKNDCPKELKPGMQRYLNPEYPDYFIDVDPIEVSHLQNQLEADGYLQRNSIPTQEEQVEIQEAFENGDEIDLEGDEDDGYCLVTRQEINRG